MQKDSRNSTTILKKKDPLEEGPANNGGINWVSHPKRFRRLGVFSSGSENDTDENLAKSRLFGPHVGPLLG